MTAYEQAYVPTRFEEIAGITPDEQTRRHEAKVCEICESDLTGLQNGRCTNGRCRRCHYRHCTQRDHGRSWPKKGES